MYDLSNMKGDGNETDEEERKLVENQIWYGDGKETEEEDLVPMPRV